MTVEYRWFKNGKEAMYTLDLEGEQVTKTFWDNGNVKLEIKNAYGNFAYPEMKKYYRSGKIKRYILIGMKKITLVDYDDNEKTDKTIMHRAVVTDENPLEGFAHSPINVRKKIAEPTTIIINHKRGNDKMYFKMNWFTDKDVFLNDYCPNILIYDTKGNVTRLKYFNDTTNALIYNIDIGDDANLISFNHGDDGESIDFRYTDDSELSQLPKDVYDEFNRLLDDFKRCKEHYYKKYFEDVFKDKDVIALMSSAKNRIEEEDLL